MADEVKATEPVPDSKAAAADTEISDSELASAWDVAVGAKEPEPPKEEPAKEEPVVEPEKVEAKVEEPQKEEPKAEEPVEPKTPQERTRFGRMLKAQEDRIKQLEEALQAQGKTVPEAVPATHEEEEERYVTTKDFPEVMAKLDEASAKYEQAYLSQLAKFAKDVDETLFAEVYDEMVKSYNVRRGQKYKPETWNPFLDAEINWDKARAAVFERKAKTPKPNVKAEKTEAALGISATTRVESPKKPELKLDDAALSVLKGSGLTEDEIREALSADVPWLQKRANP